MRLFTQSSANWAGLANALGGICLAAFFVLHPGGGDPPTVEAALSPAYGLEHTLGLAATALLILGLPALAARLAWSTSSVARVACALAFVGDYLLGGVIFFDAYFVPSIAANAPAMLGATGPLNTPPVVLADAVPGVLWGLGYLVLASVALARASFPRPASCLVLLGAIVVNLPPQPVGPAPLWLIALGSVVMGGGLAWWGLSLWHPELQSRYRLASVEIAA